MFKFNNSVVRVLVVILVATVAGSAQAAPVVLNSLATAGQIGQVSSQQADTGYRVNPAVQSFQVDTTRVRAIIDGADAVAGVTYPAGANVYFWLLAYKGTATKVYTYADIEAISSYAVRMRFTIYAILKEDMQVTEWTSVSCGGTLGVETGTVIPAGTAVTVGLRVVPSDKVADAHLKPIVLADLTSLETVTDIGHVYADEDGSYALTVNRPVQVSSRVKVLDLTREGVPLASGDVVLEGCSIRVYLAPRLAGYGSLVTTYEQLQAIASEYEDLNDGMLVLLKKDLLVTPNITACMVDYDYGVPQGLTIPAGARVWVHLGVAKKNLLGLKTVDTYKVLKSVGKNLTYTGNGLWTATLKKKMVQVGENVEVYVQDQLLSAGTCVAAGQTMQARFLPLATGTGKTVKTFKKLKSLCFQYEQTGDNELAVVLKKNFKATAQWRVIVDGQVVPTGYIVPAGAAAIVRIGDLLTAAAYDDDEDEDDDDIDDVDEEFIDAADDDEVDEEDDWDDDDESGGCTTGMSGWLAVLLVLPLTKRSK